MTLTIPLLMRDGLSDGTLYAAPFYGESSMVMYRKDLTDAGVTIADNDLLGKHHCGCRDARPRKWRLRCLFAQGWGDGMASSRQLQTLSAWFDADMRPTLTRTSRNAAVTMYVNLLNNYGPPGSATPSTRSAFVQRRQVWPVDRCDNRCSSK
jgi:sorbitol/mannitol transport system substrate-binding protein